MPREKVNTGRRIGWRRRWSSARARGRFGDDSHENRGLARVYGDALAEKLGEVASSVDAEAQRFGAAGFICGKAAAQFFGAFEIGVHREEESISREPLRQKGGGGFGLPLQQHVSHGAAVER